MITDRSNGEILIRCTPHEACLIALALDGYGDAIDARCTPLAAALCPSPTRPGIVTVDELDACAQSAPEPGMPVEEV